MTPTTVSLREAAESLGVHYMTAYRYVRLGMLPAHKEGSSWRVNAADLEAFRVRDEVKPGTEEGTGPRGARWEQRLESRLLAGDERGAWGVIEAAMASGMETATVYIDLVAPAMRSIGQAWHDGHVDISTEHRATAIVIRILGRLSPRLARRGRTRGTVVIGGLAGERHSLPVTMVADLLRSGGWDVMDLGADLPTDSLVAAAAGVERLVAVGLSVTTLGRDDDTAEAVAVIHQALPGVPVILGGSAIEGTDHAARLGGDLFAAGPYDAITRLDELTA